MSFPLHLKNPLPLIGFWYASSDINIFELNGHDLSPEEKACRLFDLHTLHTLTGQLKQLKATDRVAGCMFIEVLSLSVSVTVTFLLNKINSCGAFKHSFSDLTHANGSSSFKTIQTKGSTIKSWDQVELLTVQCVMKMMFVSNKDQVYILDKAEGNTVQVSGCPMWGTVW
ncbi:hypothetical protein ARMGADRAFT_1029415 [Armillaria gallica]|uniref:Uncharacterized protein n=1 Tax=Armillaria gallica TaxID=47427 RepID=A0A2H3DK88_ARMGA|nr:hypothetical protein ARMGADRAFT_1029415 [Armillaria gallica]